MSEKKAGRGNLLDLFLIFLLLFSLLGALFRWDSLRQSNGGESERLLAVLVLRAVDPCIAECLREGEGGYRVSGEYFGELVAKAIRPSGVTCIEDGVWVEGEWDSSLFCDLYLTFSFLGRRVGSRVLHSGTQPLSVGQSITLYTERAELHATVVSLAAESSLETKTAENGNLVFILHEKF